MNICIISQRYPYKNNLEFVFVKKLVDEWAQLGHKCVVVADFSWITFLRRRIGFRPRHYSYNVAPSNTVDVYYPRRLTTGLSFNGVDFDSHMAMYSVSHQIKKLGLEFDFIYCHFFTSSLYVYKYARSHRIPLFIATGESSISVLNKPYRQFTFDEYRDYTCGVIAVSSKNKSEAVEKGLISPEKCQVFPNGTNLSIFHPISRALCRKELALPSDCFIVSCVGFICERKGQNRLLEAVRRLNDKGVKLMFVGNEAKVGSFSLEGDEILFKGPVENKRLPTYLCASDVFCLPTKAEGCCNAVIEALACGIPVISSNLPFNWDVLDESNSIMVNPDNIDDIALAIERIKDDESLHKQLSSGALLKSQSLSLSKRANDILTYIETRIDIFNNESSQSPYHSR